MGRGVNSVVERKKEKVDGVKGIVNEIHVNNCSLFYSIYSVRLKSFKIKIGGEQKKQKRHFKIIRVKRVQRYKLLIINKSGGFNVQHGDCSS